MSSSLNPYFPMSIHFGSKSVWVDAPPRTLFPRIVRAPYMAPCACSECIVAGKAEAPEAPEEEILQEWEFIAVSPTPIIRAWSRMVRGILTISNLRGFWGHLGHFLKEVKKRSLGN